MPTLVFSFDEIMFLSALAPTKPSYTYPLQHLLGREGGGSQVEIGKIHDSFLRDGLILHDRRGSPHLNGELAVIFSILNRPEESLHLRAFARSETPRYLFCGRKGRWIVLTFGKSDSFFAVTYLFKLEDCARWFSYDLLGREEFKEPYFTPVEIRLTSIELAVLAVMQGIYKGRVEMSGARLTERQLQLSWKELCSRENTESARKVLPYELDGDKFHQLFADMVSVRAVAGSLAQKNILQLTGTGVTFAPFGKIIFDPGKVKNMFVCTRPGFLSLHKTLQVYEGGFLLLRPLMREQGQVSLQLLPASVPGEEVFHRLMNWQEEILAPTPVAAGIGGKAEGETTRTAKAASAKEEGWYLYMQEQQYGPYSWLQLQQFAQEGRLQLDSMVWHGELPNWTQAAEIEGLFQ